MWGPRATDKEIEQYIAAGYGTDIMKENHERRMKAEQLTTEAALEHEDAVDAMTQVMERFKTPEDEMDYFGETSFPMLDRVIKGDFTEGEEEMGFDPEDLVRKIETAKVFLIELAGKMRDFVNEIKTLSLTIQESELAIAFLEYEKKKLAIANSGLHEENAKLEGEIEDIESEDDSEGERIPWEDLD